MKEKLYGSGFTREELLEMLNTGKKTKETDAILEQLTDKELLSEIARQAKDPYSRYLAIKKLSKKELKRLVEEESDSLMLFVIKQQLI